MVPLVTRLLRSMGRNKEPRQLTTLVSSADHASSDGIRAVPGGSMEWKTLQAFNRGYFPTCQHLGARQFVELFAALSSA